MPDPAIPPEAEAPSGRSEDSLPTMAPNPSRKTSEDDPTDAGTAGDAPPPPAP